MLQKCVSFGLLAGIVAACTGAAEDAFAGRYSGTYTCRGENLDTGARFEGDPIDSTIAIELDSTGRAFLAGSCTIYLEVIGATRAEIVPRSCSGTTDEGEAFTAEIREGVVSRREPRLGYVVSSINTSASSRIAATCEFDGERVE